MDKHILVLNVGSSSTKFSLYRVVHATLSPVLTGQVTRVEQHNQFTVHYSAESSPQLWQEHESADHHSSVISRILQFLDSRGLGLAVTTVGHRVVHGGMAFSAPVLINDEVFASLQQLQALAPLHQIHNLQAIATVKRYMPKVRQVACFDTAFHRSMPAVAQTFAIPKSLTEQGIRPYGFHGLSYQYIASVLPSIAAPQDLARVVVAHLGSGASLCAMRDLHSVATTMSFTPLDGLAMATRSGAIDPGALLYLLKNKTMTVEQLEQLLNHQSGLLGLSGISADLAVLLASNQPDAVAAVAHYIYRIVLALASMVAAIGGINTLVFTAGIGQHSPQLRERVCQQLAWLGINLDAQANLNNARCISSRDSKVAVYVIATDEELMIAQHCLELDANGESKKDNKDDY
ncbi:acetate/propionate family kinase [Dasania marina]|uniref:acetate/propionate family kinase n=1 Tax=Dasania marina TaxID=471499 RepID=UPI0030DA1D5A|tara:strand:- start:26750 stop:27961 length:1212 start_codon:yes stop_codon:yes gene_type:complete